MTQKQTDCPVCRRKLRINPLSNILNGYAPYYCKICDLCWYEEDLK